MTEPTQAAACRQHPDRVGGVLCQRCGAPMCVSCMHQASVGYHCPQCVQGHAKATAPARRAAQVALQGHRPIVTQVIIAICALVYGWDMLSGANPMTGSPSRAAQEFALFAPLVESGQWYRVFTAAFTHSGLIHIGFNMWLLWMLGQGLEGRFGPLTFGSMYVTGILGGSLGAMLVEPRASVVGASGAVFALMGVVLVLQRMGGVSIFQSGIGGLVMINVLLSFRGGISLGGHLGGLAVGLLMGWLLGRLRSQGKRAESLAPLVIGGIGLACLVLMFPVIDRAVASFG